MECFLQTGGAATPVNPVIAPLSPASLVCSKNLNFNLIEIKMVLLLCLHFFNLIHFEVFVFCKIKVLN